MTALVFALPFEAAALQSVSPDFQVWVLHATGRRAAAAFLARLESSPLAPTLVVSAGLAGGLNPNLRVGDLLRHHDSDPLPPFATDVPHGTVFTAESLVASADDKRMLRLQTGADACDMESAFLFALCRDRGLPCIGLRAISDPAGQSLPIPSEALLDPQSGRPNPSAIALALLRRPTSIPAFAQLIRNAAKARASLARCLQGNARSFPG